MKKQIQVFNYSIVNSSDGNHLDVYIDGVIVDAETQEIYQKWFGDETSVSFKSVRNQVNESGAKNITFWVNSYGGHVGDAMAIHDWIQDLDNKSEYTIKTKGIGMVCSAATYIVSAAKDSEITKNSWYMIHNVSGWTWGDVNQIENYARTMRKFNDTIVEFYSTLTGKSKEQVSDWMNAETWFTGVEAAEYGFVNKCTGQEVEFKNTIDPQLFPYQNQSALAAYNSFVGKPKPTDNQEETLIINDSNMNKFIEAIVNAFKSQNLIAQPKPKESGEGGDNPENGGEAPATAELTEESLTNAFTEAFNGFDFSEMIDNRLNEMFKDGLPENLQNALGKLISNKLDENKGDNPLESEEFQNLKNEVEEIKGQIVDNTGGAKPKNTGNPIDVNEHDGVTWE